MSKINRLLWINKNSIVLIYSICVLYIILFFLMLLASTPYPILTLIIVLSAFPTCLWLVITLFKYKMKLENIIIIRLTRIVKHEIYMYFEANDISFKFDVEPAWSNDKGCYFCLLHQYTNSMFCKLCLNHLAKINSMINDKLPNWYNITLSPIHCKNMPSDVIV